MPDYQQGKIYTIRCRIDDSMIYVGSTTQSLAKRWDGHKVKSRKEGMLNRLIYKKVNNEWKNWYIELYELYPCSCKEELCRKEGEIIRLIGNLNTQLPCRTQEEQKEKKAEDFKKWNENNKEHRLIYSKEYGKKYYDENKNKLLEQYKKYRDENKDKEKERQRKKYQDNKEIITCVCGCNSTKHNLNRHLKSKRHIDLMAVQALPQPVQVQDALQVQQVSPSSL